MTENNPYTSGKSIGKLIDDLGTVAQPGSVVHEQIKAALDARIAEQQQAVAKKNAQWAKWSAIGTVVAAAIALAAFLT